MRRAEMMGLAGATEIMATYRRWPVQIASGRGSIVTDTQGRSYIDLVGGIAVCSIGHCHPAVVDAITSQAARLIHASNLYHTRPQEELARKLARLSGGHRSFFANSGAEAVECALKLARKWAVSQGKPGPPRIVAAAGGFHGRTFGALAATGQPAKQAPFAPMLPGFDHVPYGDTDAMAMAMGTDVAAVILEPIQGEGGVVVPPDGYFAAVREQCDEWGALLVVDEVQTGLGRTGYWFAHEHYGVGADVICLAKALAGGLPMSACLARPEVAGVFEPGDHATTFGGGPVPAAAALAVLRVSEQEGLPARAAELGARLAGWLEDALPGCTVRGRGLLVGVELNAPVAAKVAAAALQRGVLVNDATPSVVRLTPALNIPQDELRTGIDKLTEAFQEVGERSEKEGVGGNQ